MVVMAVRPPPHSRVPPRFASRASRSLAIRSMLLSAQTYRLTTCTPPLPFSGFAAAGFGCRNHCGVQFAVPQATHEATYEWLLGDENWASIKQARALCSKAYLVRPEVQTRECLAKLMLLPQLLEESQNDPSTYEEALSWLEEVERYFGLAADTTVDYASQHLELRTQIVLSHLRRAPPRHSLTGRQARRRWRSTSNPRARPSASGTTC